MVENASSVAYNMQRYAEKLEAYLKTVAKFVKQHQRFFDHYRRSNPRPKATHQVPDVTRAKRQREDSGDPMPQKQRKLRPPPQTAEGAETHNTRSREAVTNVRALEQVRDARADIMPTVLHALKGFQEAGERLYQDYQESVILPNLCAMENLGFDYDWNVALAGAWTFAHISILRDFYNFPGEEMFPVLADKYITWEAFVASSYSKISRLYQDQIAPIKAIILDNVIEFAKCPDMILEDCYKFNNLLTRDEPFGLENLPPGFTTMLRNIMQTDTIKTTYENFLKEVVKDLQPIDEVYSYSCR